MYIKCLPLRIQRCVGVRGRASRELKRNSRGWRRQRRQNNKTNYTRRKAHVNMWNKACSISTLSAKCGQYFNNYRRSFRLRRHAEGSWISAKIDTNSGTKANTCSEKHKDYVEIFLLLADVAVLYCFSLKFPILCQKIARFPLHPWKKLLHKPNTRCFALDGPAERSTF